MDRHFDDQGFNDSGLKTRPSELFRRNCWISFEPVEGSLNVLADYVGPHKIMWATDYPHPDGFFPGAPDMVRERLKGLSPETAAIFKAYRWPGNVRELRNIIERASILEDGEYVTAAHLPADMLAGESVSGGGGGAGFVLPAEGVPLETVEIELARQALARTGGNLTRAAKLLDISRDQLRYKLKKSGDLAADGDESGE